MLIELKVKSRIAICYLEFLLLRDEQVLDMLLTKKGTSQHPHDLVNVSIKFHFMFDDCYEAICTYRSINLNSHSIFGIAPKCCDPKMLLYPFEEQFDQPSTFIKESDLFGREHEIICIESKCLFQIWNISDNPSNGRGIVLGISFARKPYSLITENIPLLNYILSGLHYIFRMSFLTDYKEGVDKFDFIKPCQIPVSTVKYISGQRFVINIIHCIDIMNSGICNIYHGGYLRDNIKLGMHLDSRFGAPEFSPVEYTHAQVYGCRVKSIESSSDTKFPVNSGILCRFYHMIGVFLIDSPVTKIVASGKNVSIHQPGAKPQMKTAFSMGCRNIGKFPQTFTTKQLAEYKRQEVSPIRQLPPKSTVFWSVLLSGFKDPFEFTFWQKVSHLAENVSSCIHWIDNCGFPTKLVNSKVRQVFCIKQYFKSAS